MSKLSFSGLVSFAIVTIVLYFTFNTGITRIYSWDAFGQYIYLPMLVDRGTWVFHDLNYFIAINDAYKLTDTLYQFVTLENGNFMTKYTMGLAVLLSPFYLVAELIAQLTGYETDGFSYPYQVMAAIGSSFYFVLGQYYFRKLLLQFFPDKLSGVLMVLAVFGTNFLFMQYASLGSTHNFEFTLLCLMLYFTIRFHKEQSLKNGLVLSLVIGLIALVRLPDVMLALIPICWKRSKEESFLLKLKSFFAQKRGLLIGMVLVTVGLISLQLLYWRLNSGSWFMNSYANNPGEGFDWFHPYFYEILLSFKKGWFVYTPLMFFAVLSCYFLYTRFLNGKIMVLTFLLFFYAISCWTTWWYAASFSCRALVDIYPLLIIALGFLFVEIAKHRIKFVFYAVVFLLVCLNVFQTLQATKGIIHTDRMTKQYYFSTFGQLSAPSAKQQKLLSLDRNEIFVKKKIDFGKFHKTKEKTIIFPKKVLINDTAIYAPKVAFPWRELSSSKYFWLRIKWTYEGSRKQLEGKIFNTCAMYKDKAYGWEGRQVPDTLLLVNDSLQTVEFVYFTPHFRTNRDMIHFGLWRQAGEPFYVKSVKFEVFEPYFENE